MISTSFKSIEEILTAERATLFPKKISLQGYKNIWTQYPFLIYFRNSITVVLASTVTAVVFSTLAGYGFSRFAFRTKSALMLFILTTQMFPSVMLFIPYFKLLTSYGLANTRFGLSLVYIGSVIPFCSWMMYGFFDSISRELDEAALIDGCGRLRTFIQIVAPLTLPGLISTTIYAFIQGWNEYMFAMLFTTSDDMKTLPVAIGQMIGFYKVMWNDLMAASIVSSIPVLIMFIFLQRYFISSLTRGAVKG
jgi:multiple sugar transport system permease protein/raffinose/stachyose/melibiose transport system permease protein